MNKKSSKIEIINKIYLIFLCINIVMLNIFVGSSHREPRLILETIIILEATVYLIINKILKNKNLLIKGKIDIAITALTIITFLPLVFRTYASLGSTVNMCMQYVTVYSMYIIARNVVTTEKRKNIVVNVSLASSIAIVIFGMDKLFFDVFNPFHEYIKSAKSNTYGMVSTLGYSNAVFAYISFFTFIALGKFMESKKIISKCIYAVYIQLAMYGFYYGNSRLGMIFFALIFIVYLLKINNIKNMLKAVMLIAFTYVQVVCFDKFKGMYINNYLMWLGLIATLVTCGLGVIIARILWKKIGKNIKIKKFNKKKTMKLSVIIVAIIVAITTVYILIAKNYSKPREFCEGKKGFDIYPTNDMKKNKTYTIKINYTAEVNGEPIEIIVNEQNKYRYSNKIGSITIEETGENQTVEIQVTNTDINLSRDKLTFIVGENCKIIVNKVYINNKEYIANYKYIPNDIMRMFKTLNFNVVSVSERFSMYRSGLKLAGKSILIGNGGKAYENLYGTVREYNYSTKEIHSYYMDILVDYGLLGLIAVGFIVGITIRNYRKKTDKKSMLNLSIYTAIIFVLIHTIFDFDLAYLLTICNFYMYVAIINESDKKISIKHDTIIEWIVTVILIVITAFNGFGIYGKYLYDKGSYEQAFKFIPYSKELKYNYITGEEAGKNLIHLQKCTMDYLNNEKDTHQLEIIRHLFTVSNLLLKEGKEKEAIEGYKFIYNKLMYEEYVNNYDVRNLEEKANFLQFYLLKLKSLNNFELRRMSRSLAKKFEDEYSKNVEIIKDNERNLQSQNNVEIILNNYERMYNSIKIYI